AGPHGFPAPPDPVGRPRVLRGARPRGWRPGAVQRRDRRGLCDLAFALGKEPALPDGRRPLAPRARTLLVAGISTAACAAMIAAVAAEEHGFTQEALAHAITAVAAAGAWHL